MKPATTEEILEAFRTALANHPGNGEVGVTGPEYARANGLTILRARSQIRWLLETGQAELVTVQRIRLDGRPTYLTGYRLKK